LHQITYWSDTIAFGLICARYYVYKRYFVDDLSKR